MDTIGIITIGLQYCDIIELTLRNYHRKLRALDAPAQQHLQSSFTVIGQNDCLASVKAVFTFLKRSHLIFGMKRFKCYKPNGKEGQ